MKCETHDPLLPEIQRLRLRSRLEKALDQKAKAGSAAPRPSYSNQTSSARPASIASWPADRRLSP